MNPSSNDERIKQLIRCIPSLFETNGTCLYIGGESNRIDLVQELFLAEYKITLLEIWEPNCEHYKNNPMFVDIINVDIRQFDSKRTWDITVWWHGPEHILKEELPRTLKSMEYLTKRLLVLACPWGEYQEKTLFGNPYEAHLASLYEEDFEIHGFETDVIGEKDIPGSNLLAWKEFLK